MNLHVYLGVPFTALHLQRYRVRLIIPEFVLEDNIQYKTTVTPKINILNFS